MLILGYTCYISKNNIRIWHNNYDQKKGYPLVFFHASVGGLAFQFSVFKHFHENYNIIMPEIPGVSFIDTIDPPPDINDIVDDVNDFIKNYSGYIQKIEYNIKQTEDKQTEDKQIEDKKIEDNELKINLMGHSLGNSICTAFINKYPKLIDNFFCVEGQIFYHRSMKIFSDFYNNAMELPWNDLLTVPLFHRDLYVQYFMLKRLSIDNCCIYDLNDEDNKHIKIHMYHILSDTKIQIKPQLEYAKKKNIPVVYHLFEDDYSHGSFAFNSKFRNYVITNVLEIYKKKLLRVQ
jgi:pimeloyl-ACP methyl ester carboxylesterase